MSALIVFYLVFGGVAFSAWCLLVRLRRRGPGQGGDDLGVIARAAVNQKQGVVLFRVGKRVLVLSAGEGGVRPLGELDPDEALSWIGAAAPRTERSPVALARDLAARLRPARADSVSFGALLDADRGTR